MEQLYVGYCRVSTAEQGDEGHSLDAQQAVIRDYVDRKGGRLIGMHVEIESGTKCDRPILEKAMRQADAFRATLIVTRLDRFARNVAFISRFMETKAEFVAVDCPEANRLLLHISAVLAEYEARLISERTKAGMKAAIAKGVKMGTARPSVEKLREGGSKGGKVAGLRRRAEAERRASVIREMLHEAVSRGDCERTVRSQADWLNSQGVPRPTRGTPWTEKEVRRLMAKARC